jgi:hypothetical protein
MRRAVSLAIVLLALAGAPPLDGMSPNVSAQEKDKKDKKDKDDKDDKDKEAERKRREDEERKKREKRRLEDAIKAIAEGFAAKNVGAVLLNVPEGKDDAVELRLDDAKKLAVASFSKVHARAQLEAFFGEWKVIRVDTRSISVEENVASVPLSLFKTSAEDTPKGKRLRIKVGSADDKHPLVKLVVVR